MIEPKLEVPAELRDLAEKTIALIDREADHASQGRPGLASCSAQ